ncbi:MAG: MltA domain-containing protein [Lautropia sp.]|nr:MltA domain-containing protein [Lautropia sp.]
MNTLHPLCRHGRRLCLISTLALLAACQSTPPKAPAPTAPPAPVAIDALPGIEQDDLNGLDQAIRRQCLLPKPPGQWPTLCTEFSQLSPDSTSLRHWLNQRFVARELLDDKQPDGLLTGYYEPLLTGSREREHPRQVPLRAMPTDLLIIDLGAVAPKLKGMRLRGRLDGQRVVPYANRQQIEDGERLHGIGAQPVIAWADDPVDAFFLEIQGSGRLQLRDGSMIRIGYADQNGHPYQAIGNTLVRRGALKKEEVTAPAIQAWLRAHPEEGRKVMQTNPGVVFFRELPDSPDDPGAGPLGAMSVPLTPHRSLAVDRSRIPLGSPVFIQSTHPVSQQPMARMMLAQDTGGAIRGGRRGDYFWGFGPDAGLAAGLMKAPARMWLLVPRGLR